VNFIVMNCLVTIMFIAYQCTHFVIVNVICLIDSIFLLARPYFCFGHCLASLRTISLLTL